MKYSKVDTVNMLIYIQQTSIKSGNMRFSVQSYHFFESTLNTNRYVIFNPNIDKKISKRGNSFNWITSWLIFLFYI